MVIRHSFNFRYARETALRLYPLVTVKESDKEQRGKVTLTKPASNKNKLSSVPSLKSTPVQDLSFPFFLNPVSRLSLVLMFGGTHCLHRLNIAAANT
ncbi:hypothetical protein BaRGS_00019380 [Batillaria attramentaria]|uniref:Uncharacterized protein n=1 Tax=Batillaria attramentaria TaxID=370345 RepID=A0ABD0KQR6_9CAEN